MDYCAPRGIPHSEFLSWPIDDQAKALGWQSEQRQACQHCGTHEWEWEADRFAYSAETYVCPGCMHLETLQKNSSKLAEDMHGLKFRLVKNGGSDGN